MTRYCLGNARSPAQAAEMRRLEAAGICLFCPDGLARHPWPEVAADTAHWTAVPNEFAYPGTALHLLLVPRQHASDLLALPAEVRADFWVALAAVAERYRLSHYGLGVRNGDCRFTGATIAHVHAHLLVGDTAAENAPPVRMRFSSRPGRARPDPVPPGSA